MKFSAKEDIAAPADFVFDQIVDFDSFEEQAQRRGAEIERISPPGHVGQGMKWDIRFNFRGRQRKMKTELQNFDAPNELTFYSRVGGLQITTQIDVIPLAQSKTRIAMSFDLKPTSLSARLLLQSMRLIKGNLTKRYKARVQDYATELQGRYQNQR
ncbi:SRPBCC family protein [Pseudaestuariivita rosea]|uniref:SRPBCC family protein n=1 Tax=Pseudaestuariivita rosea TaxID=2763263 RepID=UPI001ABAF462|nr:SRPBCC family protein [Pseudaestuariivita rosea]